MGNIEIEIKKRDSSLPQTKNLSGQYVYTKEKEMNYAKYSNQHLNKSASLKAKSY